MDIANISFSGLRINSPKPALCITQNAGKKYFSLGYKDSSFHTLSSLPSPLKSIFFFSFYYSLHYVLDTQEPDAELLKANEKLGFILGLI